MKTIIVPISAVIIIVLLWLGFMSYTEKQCELLNKAMTGVYECALKGEWDAARQNNLSFLKLWNKCSDKFSIYMESTCVHDIELSAERCQGYIYSKNQPLACGESASILAHLKLMKEYDKIQYANIF